MVQFADNAGPDQPVRLHMLIRAIIVSAFAQADQSLCCQLPESVDDVYVDKQRMLRSDTQTAWMHILIWT